jgi:Family of unknown function (DUF6788)
VPNLSEIFFARVLTFERESVSFLRMRHERIIARRQKLLDRLPVTGEVLRGSLLERTIRNHASGCAKCASGEGHALSVLTVTYPGGRTQQFSLRRERVGEVRRWLRNYQELKEAIEAICELNHELLRPDKTASTTRRKSRD